MSTLPPACPSVAVVVTLSHRTCYTPDEELSLRHVRHYLNRYDTYALVPESHPVTYPGLIAKRFSDRFFGSARAHGSLLLSPRFYRAFRAYEFVLICHLDALVFSDQLAEWCNAGYDYIGAPWLISPDTPQITEQKVGNGGFSLRRVRSFLRVLESRRYFVDPDEYWRSYAARTGGLLRLLNAPRKYLKRLLPLNDVHWHIRWALRDDVHEDRFWSEYATFYDASFRIAPVEIAMRFAFEAEPRKCFERIGRQLPFGAHRWQKFDRAFYEPYLLRDGVESGAPLGSAEAGGHYGDTKVARASHAVARVAES
jgi:Protein of unknown function (DUF5672)